VEATMLCRLEFIMEAGESGGSGGGGGEVVAMFLRY